MEVDTDVSSMVKFNNHAETVQKVLDVVKKTAYGVDFVIWGLENQSKIHYAMPLRHMICLLYTSPASELIRRESDRIMGKIYIRTICFDFGNTVFMDSSEMCIRDSLQTGSESVSPWMRDAPRPYRKSSSSYMKKATSTKVPVLSTCLLYTSRCV